MATNNPRNGFKPRPSLEALGEQAILDCLKAAFEAMSAEDKITLRRYCDRTGVELGRNIGQWSVLRLLLVTEPETVAGLDALDQEIRIARLEASL